MGKAEKRNAKELHSSAEEALLLNKNELALNLYLNSSKLYLLDEKYGNAQKDFSAGLDIALKSKDETNTKYLPDLLLGLATSYLLDNELQECLETIEKLIKFKLNASTPLTFLDFSFINNAVNILLIEGNGKTFTPWEKKLNDKDEQIFVRSFHDLVQLQQKGSHEQSKDKTILLARAWYL
jgi:hypothetical protein